jgi:hypothetical protein
MVIPMHHDTSASTIEDLAFIDLFVAGLLLAQEDRLP